MRDREFRWPWSFQVTALCLLAQPKGSHLNSPGINSIPKGSATGGSIAADRKLQKLSRRQSMSVISVIVGTTREARFSEKPAHWILEHLKKRQDVDARLLDLRDFPMPFFDQPLTPAMPGRPAFENEAVQRWTAAIGASDGYVIATAEYNYGPAAVLK